MERELKHFVAIADHGSVTQAAMRLGLTQPALTKSLQRLEAHLGLLLVERGSRGTRLTPEGKAILARARSVEAELRYLDLEAAGFRGSALRQIRFGASPSWGSSVVPEIIKKVRAQHPDIQLTVVMDLEGPLIDLLAEGSIDFAIGGNLPAAQHHGIDFQPIAELDLLLACRRQHPLWRRWSGDRTELLAQDWIDFRSALGRKRGPLPPLRHEITGSVLDTDSWALVPLIAAHNDLLVVLPEHLGEYIALFGLGFLSDSVRIDAISAGVWSRTSVAETKIGKSLLAMIRAEIAQTLGQRRRDRTRL